MIHDSWLWLWWLVMIERWMIHRWYDMMAHNQNLKNPVQGPPPKSGCPGRWYGHPAEWQLRSWRRIPLHRPVSGALLPWRGLHWCELRSPSTSPSAQVRTTAQCVGLSGDSSQGRGGCISWAHGRTWKSSSSCDGLESIDGLESRRLPATNCRPQTV